MMNTQVKKKTLHAALALALALPPVTAMAITEVESEEVVVSATKTERILREVPSTVTLVNAKKSAQYGQATIADMVQDVPGVEIFDNSVAGSKRLMIRGENGGRVIVLIDGQKINEQKSMDGAPLLVDPAVVERIEVVKGSGSVLYGSDAIGGVVNIITKKGGKKPLSGDMSGAYRSGTEGYDGSVGLAGSAGNMRYRLTGSYSDQGDRKTPDKTLEGSESTMKNVSGFVGYQTEPFDAGFTIEKYEVEADVPPTRIEMGPMSAIMDLDLPEWSREKVGLFLDFKDLSEMVTKVHFDAYYQKTMKDFVQEMGLPMAAFAGMGGMGGSSMKSSHGKMPHGKKPHGKMPHGKRTMSHGKVVSADSIVALGGHPSNIPITPGAKRPSNHPKVKPGAKMPAGHPKVKPGAKMPAGHPKVKPGGKMPAGHPMVSPGAGMPAGHSAIVTQFINTENDQRTYSANGQVDLAVTDAHYLIGGIAFSYDTLDATTNTRFSIPFIPRTSYFQEANVINWALYLQDEWSVTDDVTLTFGVRETWVESELEETNDPRIKPGTIRDSHPAFSAGITWNTSDTLTLRSLFSQGYRFPDLTQLFIGTTHGGEMTMANPNLDPETSNNFEVGARFADGHLKTDFALFCSLAENYINRRTIAAGYNRYENVDEARTYGAEIWMGYRFDPFNIEPYVNGTVMRREYEDDAFSTWKTKTPLFSSRFGVRFEQPLESMVAKIWGDFYVRSAAKAEEEKRNGQIITNDAWSTLNLALGTSWGENDMWQFSINLNNLFDKSYTTAQNSLEEEGMNVVARLAVSF